MYDLYFFFFQAEDGIRDLTVTGVQTCALPISSYLHCPDFVSKSKSFFEGSEHRSGAHPQKRSEEHTSELQSQSNLVCRLLLEKKKTFTTYALSTPYTRVHS